MIRRIAIAALLFALPATAHEYEAGALTIGHPVVYAAPPTAKAAAGYMTIANSGDSADRLTGVTVGIDGARAEMHHSEMADGVMRMVPQDAVEVPAGGEAVLAPGGFHVMILGLPEAPAEGDTIDATLTFEQAGDVAVTFNVEARPEDGAGHSSH